MPELSVIVPTYEERGNLRLITHALREALDGIDYEIIFVDDDSPDGTSAAARTLAQSDTRVRVIQRIGRKGLASAVVEGLLASSAPYLAVIDADLQHDETILPQMLAKLKSESLDIVIGSRNSGGGSMGAFKKERVALSDAGRRLSQWVCGTSVSDPMSGYFVLTRSFFHEVAHSLSLIGFKILVDLLASARRPVRVGEAGYRFRNRLHGESKIDILVGLEYLELLLDKATGGWIPVSYMLFGLVGAAGIGFNFFAASVFMQWAQVAFLRAQTYGALLTIAFNFFLNNAITFRAARMRGVRLLQGVVLFYLACSVGLVAQLAVANSLREIGLHWAAATLAGIGIGSVWNYSMALMLVWQIKRRRGSRLRDAYLAAD